jgi:hypothetical protein
MHEHALRRCGEPPDRLDTRGHRRPPRTRRTDHIEAHLHAVVRESCGEIGDRGTESGLLQVGRVDPNHGGAERSNGSPDGAGRFPKRLTSYLIRHPLGLRRHMHREPRELLYGPIVEVPGDAPPFLSGGVDGLLKVSLAIRLRTPNTARQAPSERDLEDGEGDQRHDQDGREGGEQQDPA